MNRILVVEDEPELVTAVTTKLEKEGFEVLKADNGKHAWDVVEKEKIDCIILDIILPFTDGVWFLEKLRADAEKTKIPVIVFTNLSEGEKVSKIIALGAYRLLVKAETSLNTLVNTIREVLRVYQ